jgi:nitrogen fixation protein FixH
MAHSENASLPRSSGSLWYLMPIVLLGGLLTLLGVLLAIATSDDGFAVEPDYYRKATRWDETMRERHASEVLGWQSRVTLTRELDGTRIEVALSDAAGEPLFGAQVSLEAFANARASQVHRVALGETDAGRYVGSVPSRRGGLWEVRVDARGPGGEHYLGVSRVDAEVGSE